MNIRINLLLLASVYTLSIIASKKRVATSITRFGSGFGKRYPTPPKRSTHKIFSTRRSEKFFKGFKGKDKNLLPSVYPIKTTLFSIPKKSWVPWLNWKHKLGLGTVGTVGLGNMLINYLVPARDDQVKSENFLRYTNTPAGRENLLKFAKENPKKYLKFIIQYWDQLLKPAWYNPYKDQSEFIVDFFEQVIGPYASSSVMDTLLTKIGEDFIRFNNNKNSHRITKAMIPYLNKEQLPKMSTLAKEKLDEILAPGSSTETIEILLRAELDRTMGLSLEQQVLSSYIVNNFANIINKKAYDLLLNIQNISYFQEAFTKFLINQTNLPFFVQLSETAQGTNIIFQNIKEIPGNKYHLANQIIERITTTGDLFKNTTLVNLLLIKYIDLHHNFGEKELPQQVFKQPAVLLLADQVMSLLYALDVSTPEKKRIANQGLSLIFSPKYYHQAKDIFLEQLTDLKAIRLIANRPLFETFISNEEVLKRGVLIELFKHLELFLDTSRGLSTDDIEQLKYGIGRVKKALEDHKRHSASITRTVMP